ncbi:MAG TPA: 50S ribosomal protein L13 [bacterium]|nr:50S ribosomal protein L13 [bacterium]
MINSSEIESEKAAAPIKVRDLNRTYSARPRDIQQRWYLVDAKDQPLGRLAARITRVLLGKNKECYTPHIDTGDFVVVINSASVELTGDKWDSKMYYHHTGYPGGIKSFTARQKLSRDPTFLVRKAVVGMLPKNKLSRQIVKKLKVYAGPEHPHAAQKPVPLALVE